MSSNVPGRVHPTRNQWHREKQLGIWEVRLHVSTDPATGKNRQVSRTVQAPRTRSGRIPAAVTDALARLRTEVADGLHDAPPEPEPPDVITIGRLIDDWLAHGESVGRSPATLDGYQRKIDVHISAGPRRHPADRPQYVRRRPVREATASWDVSCDGRGASSHPVGRSAQAVKWEWLAASPAANATPPSVARKQLTVPPPERVQALIEMAETSKAPEMATIIVLATTTGLRRGDLTPDPGSSSVRTPWRYRGAGATGSTPFAPLPKFHWRRMDT